MYFLKFWARLYSQPTKAEQALEPFIAKLGKVYRAQHPVFSVGHILDFALLEEKIAIEVDGASHVGPKARAKDAARTAKLEALGWVVTRMTNAEAMNDPEATLARCLDEARTVRRTHTQRKQNA